mmetsp:Transcript_10566/g.33478  ORF Transcript_10566/g.33478 Transcript_10566/m.33478 type:complete len:204 (+) Transcript_10566:83-694(+)
MIAFLLLALTLKVHGNDEDVPGVGLNEQGSLLLKNPYGDIALETPSGIVSELVGEILSLKQQLVDLQTRVVTFGAIFERNASHTGADAIGDFFPRSSAHSTLDGVTISLSRHGKVEPANSRTYPSSPGYYCDPFFAFDGLDGYATPACSIIVYAHPIGPSFDPRNWGISLTEASNQGVGAVHNTDTCDRVEGYQISCTVGKET